MCARTQSPVLVLVDTKSETSVDRDVIPAAIEYVLHSIISKKLKDEGLTRSVCLLSIDRPVRHFHAVSKRGSIPTANILDCYKNWHEEWSQQITSHGEGSIQSVWPIASTTTPEQCAEALYQAVERVFSKIHVSPSQGRIVVIDSLSSILSLSPNLDTVLHLLDSLSMYNAQNGNENLPITLVSTIQSSRLKSSLFDGLRKLADTYVAVEQLSLGPNTSSPLDMRSGLDLIQINVRKLKASGRVHFEEHVTEMDWSNVQLHKTESGFASAYSRRGENSLDKKEEAASLELAQHGLSFRVTLSSKEREVRAAAGLPYLHKNEELANSALAIHPENLRLHKDGVDGTEWDSSDSGETGSEGEDLFSEDV